MSRLTEDILPEPMKDAFPPEKVSPAVVWLCTDDAKEVTGRQFLVAGNNVSAAVVATHADCVEGTDGRAVDRQSHRRKNSRQQGQLAADQPDADGVSRPCRVR